MSDEHAELTHHQFAAETLQERMDALAREIAGVRTADDIECIHRMRVASRRLRIALTLFADCLPAKKAAAWLQDVRRVTRALGAARDADVQIEAVEEAATVMSDMRQRPGMVRLLLRLRQRRASLQRGVERALDRLEHDHTITELEGVLRRLRVQSRLHPMTPSATAPMPSLHDLAGTAIMQRLEELLSFEPYVTQPDRMSELHAMRIAAKRLRYTLEVFAPLYDDALKDPIKAAKTAQELLGDIHDCDVWLQQLPDFLEGERRRALAYSGSTRGVTRLGAGIRAFTDNRLMLRDSRYTEFVAYWKKTIRVWDALAALLTRAGE